MVYRNKNGDVVLSGTYLQNNNIDGGSDIFLNATYVSLTYSKMLGDDTGPRRFDATDTWNNMPNSRVDDIGLKNRAWTVRGFWDVHSNINGYNAHGESGIITFAKMGSVMRYTGSLFFQDGGERGLAPSGNNIWVKPRSCDINRTPAYANSFEDVGNKVNYTLVLEETI